MIKFFVKDKLADVSLLVQTLLKSLYITIVVSMFFVSLSFLFSDSPRLPYVGVAILSISLYWFSSLFFARRNLRKIDRDSGEGANVVDYIPGKLMSDLRNLRAKEREFDEDFSLGFMLYAIDLPEIRRTFERLDVSFDEFGDKIYESSEFEDEEKERRDDSVFNKVLIAAANEALAFGEKEITVFDIFLAILENGEKRAREIFKMFGIRKEDLRSAEIFERVNDSVFSGKIKYFADRFTSGNRIFNAILAPFRLRISKSFLTDITEEVKTTEAGFMIGHNREASSLRERMLAATNTGAILVGQAGSGRSSIVNNLAYSMISDQMPFGNRRRIYRVSIKDFFAADQKEMASRMEQFSREARKHKKIIFYIPNISSMIDIEGGKAFSAMIEGLASDGGAGIILSDTPEAMPVIKKTGWFKRFSEIEVREISEEEALMYLSYIASVEEKKYDLMITVSALKRAVVLARENEKNLPAGAREYLDAGIELVEARGGSEVSFAEVGEAEQSRKSLITKTRNKLKK